MRGVHDTNVVDEPVWSLPMTQSLESLESRFTALLEQISELGDFRAPPRSPRPLDDAGIPAATATNLVRRAMVQTTG